jgi:hypothetical protein
MFNLLLQMHNPFILSLCLAALLLLLGCADTESGVPLASWEAQAPYRPTQLFSLASEIPGFGDP